MIIGGLRRPVLPSIPWTSLPQMPQAFTATSTSSGPGSGAGTSSNENCLYSLSNNAFIQVVGEAIPRPPNYTRRSRRVRLQPWYPLCWRPPKGKQFLAMNTNKTLFGFYTALLLVSATAVFSQTPPNNDDFA